ncbi:MAG TPA: winged helix-turn-helix domain-containing protein [Steroidobacteraceae bacterium]|jgi:non-specific serine/threonine protein kinase
MAELYRFGPFELRPEHLQLRRGETLLKVEPKPLEVLSELVRNAGELVTKNELMDSVWAGRVVTESVIARCIAKLRTVLEDESQTLILTVHSYGYRFTGEVHRSAEEPARAEGGAAGNFSLTAGDAPALRPHWRLLRALNERCGVWLAQHDKTDERRVFKFALEPRQIRILKRELTIHRVLRRGLGERDDIARLLDYNLEALPYFLEMEYYPEGSLSDWCAAAGGAAGIALELKVELMAQAAEALAAAHALGVLHLDIKPSNLLVWVSPDGHPHIRWADFGNSRLLQPERLSEFGITRLASTQTLGIDGPAEGTLHYIAPELFRGETATVRSDLYAMGVMLYQLVAGDLRKPMAAGWEFNIADEALRADVAATANGDPAQRMSSADELARRLRGIEQRRAAFDAERARAREDAELRRKLDYARARRPWLIAAGVALTAGLAASLWNYRAAVQARDEARRQAAIADAVIDFLDRDILSAGSPFSVSGDSPGGLTVRQAVDRAEAKLAGRFPAQPAVEASVRATIGQVYVEDGDYDKAEKQVRTAVQLARGGPGGADFRTVRAEYGLVFALTVEQKFGQAKELLEEANSALAQARNIDLLTASRRDVINGNYYFALQDYRRAAPYFEQALAESLQHDSSDISQIAIRRTSLAWCYAALGRVDEAQKLYATALDEVKRAEKNGGTLTGTVEERYGIGLFLAGRDADAEKMLKAAYADLYATIGDDGLTEEALTFLGWLQLREGRTSEASVALHTAYAAEVASAGAEHRMSLRAQACLGLAEIANGEQAAGLQTLTQAVNAYDKVMGPATPEAQLFKYWLVSTQLKSDMSVANAPMMLAQLDPRQLSLADPREDWNEKLHLLQAQLVLRKAKESSSRI